MTCGRVAKNAVPDRAFCVVRAALRLTATEQVTVEDNGDGTVTLRGWGKSGHAAMPEGTVNAIGLLVNCLLDSGVCSPAEVAYLKVLQKLHASTDAAPWVLRQTTVCSAADHRGRHH